MNINLILKRPLAIRKVQKCSKVHSIQHAGEGTTLHLSRTEKLQVVFSPPEQNMGFCRMISFIGKPYPVSHKSFWSWPPKGDAKNWNCMVCYDQGKLTFQAKVLWLCVFGFLKHWDPPVKSPCMVFPSSCVPSFFCHRLFRLDWDCTSDAKPLRVEGKRRMCSMAFFFFF